ncbi:transcriptional regulator PpsR [Congregibacter variabilis]|uniref:Transcriptional regulator PpsR n=1 Tax=Congregibacter variabilis TaxID=3081200 RepID=A0ABZ0I4I0_9GAMM|nr:transcriptional regulator PpsR [Congregibacter sp. IMCC43200]
MAGLISRVADLALTLDEAGTILEVESWSTELPEDLADLWVGSMLSDTLAPGGEDRASFALAEGAQGSGQRVDLVHRLEDSPEGLPVQYQVMAGEAGQVLFVGHDLRSDVSLRQQLVNAQQALEQDYWRLRQVETRYRRLFDMVTDAVLVLDALSFRVLEANPRAIELLAGSDKGLIGKVFPRGMNVESGRAVQELLAEIRTVGRSQQHNLLLADGETRVDVSASFLRQAGEERFLLRMGTRQAVVQKLDATGVYLQELVRSAPDAVVLTDVDGRIMAVNNSFLELAQLVAQEQVIGHSADRWLGRSGVDLSVLLSNLRDKSVVKLFSSTLMPQAGSPAEVEISACRLEEPGGAAYALFIRDVERRVARDHPVSAKLPSSIEQVTQRVGRVPLKELVRESTDLIEALCIETALEVTQDNRASAAELLGLSRQSLYAKLRRFNIGGDADTD